MDMNLPILKRRQRSGWPTLTLDGWMTQVMGSFGYGGNQYPIMLGSSLGVNPQQEPPADAYAYLGYIQQAARSNSLIYACILARMMHFAEARFQWRRLQNGRPGDLFGTQELNLVETPWPQGTTGDLLSRALLDVDLAGNFFAIRRGDYLYRMRPDWVTIIMGSNQAPETPAYAWDAEILGYYYRPPQAPELEAAFSAADVVHWAPMPDPIARFRGMSWITAALSEVLADNAMSYHQRKYFEQGATPNVVVSLDPTVTQAAYKRWVQLMQENTEGVENAYRTMWLGAGATPHVVGTNLESFTEVKGHGETRVAATAGVPPIIVGLSEGLASATYSNYGEARRHMGDTTLRFLWRTFCGALSTVMVAPGGAELWYDLRDVAFMREDAKDAAQIDQVQAATIRTLIDAGFEPESVVGAVLARNWNLLTHTGLFSVQLQPPGTTFTTATPANGQAPSQTKIWLPGGGQALLRPDGRWTVIGEIPQPRNGQVGRGVRQLLEQTTGGA